MRGLSFALLIALLLSGCIKKADRLAKSSQEDEKLMQDIYSQAQKAKEEKNIFRALFLHEKNCGMGYAASCNTLAFYYYNGKVVQVDHTKAQKLYHRVCAELGDQLGCFNEANIMRTTRKDPKSALVSYQSACNAGHQPSCYNLAVMTYKGVAMDKPHKKRAKKLFNKSCQAGYKKSCKVVGLVKDGKIEYLPNDVNK